METTTPNAAATTLAAPPLPAAKKPKETPKQPQGAVDATGKPFTLPQLYRGGAFQYHVMADVLITHFGACIINDALHSYRDGVFVQGGHHLETRMLEMLPFLTTGHRREVINNLQVNPDIPHREVAGPTLIPFRSNVYDLENDRFIEYSPDTVFLNRFPWDYKPNAPEQPLVLDTITVIANNDPDVVKLLLEAIGAVFYQQNDYRGAILMLGPGNNGKSTLLNMLKQLYGPQNCSHLSLQDLNQRFRAAAIYGKAANLGDDIPTAYFSDSSLFKKCVTGEEITIENKGKDPVTFMPSTKFFYAANELPPVSDKTDGFYSRILPVPMTHDFSKGKEYDPTMKRRRWTQAEMEYLLRLAMDGLKRVITSGNFTRPKVVEDLLSEYRGENDPIAEFLEDYQSGGNVLEGAPTPDVYEHYERWCRRNGHKNATTQKRFSRQVRDKTGLVSQTARHDYFKQVNSMNGQNGSGRGKCFLPPTEKGGT